MKVGIFSLVIASTILAGCSATKTTELGSTVLLTNERPVDCKALGEAVGSQGNSWTGDLTKDADLLQGARNDLRNKAAAMGGNVVHIQALNNSSAFGSMGTTNSTVIGQVYFCKKSQ